MNRVRRSVLCLVAACALWACSDDNDGGGAGAAAGADGTAGTFVPAGMGGEAGTVSGGIGGVAGTVSGGIGGEAGTVSGGIGGEAGTVSGGIGGEAGTVTGGIGGESGAAGMMPAGMGGTGGVGPIMRGPDPTSQSATTMGPYMPQSYTSGFRTPMRFGGGTIWYPTGDAAAPFGAVSICPGFLSAESSIAGWGPFLASHGIIAFTIATTTAGDQVADRAPALMDALAIIREENSRSGSPLEGKVDVDRFGVMGWSMGGGASWVATSMNAELTASVSFAGHIATYPGGALAVAPQITVPTLMLAGSADSAILGGGMSQPMYDAIPAATPKLLYEVSGGSHNVANDPSGASGAMGRYGLSWLKVFLEGDERYRQFLLTEGPNASDFRSNLQ